MLIYYVLILAHTDNWGEKSPHKNKANFQYGAVVKKTHLESNPGFLTYVLTSGNLS